MIRTRQAIANDYSQRGIDAVVGQPLGEIQELKNIISSHPAYLDPRHPDHATIADDMSTVYRALDAATNPDTDLPKE